MITIEKNPVKKAYFEYIMLGKALQDCWEHGKNIERLTRDFTDKQMMQYIKLCNGTLNIDEVK